jgi:hypothetical protein
MKDVTLPLGSPLVDDPAEVLKALRPRMVRARRRRRAATMGAASAALTLLGGVAWVASSLDRTAQLDVVAPASEERTERTVEPLGSPPITDDHPSDADATPPSPTVSSGTTGTSPPPTAPGADQDGGQDSPATTATNPGVGSGPPSTSAPATTEAPTPGAVTQVFTSPGGSVEVGWTTTSLHLVAVVTAPGYVHEVETSGPRSLKVEFTSATREHEIEISLVDGAPVASGSDDHVSEDSDDSGEERHDPSEESDDTGEESDDTGEEPHDTGDDTSHDDPSHDDS